MPLLILVSMIETIIFTLLGVLMMRMAAQSVEEMEDVSTLVRFFSRKTALLLMVLFHFVLSVFLPAFYRVDQLTVLRTLLMCSILWACAWADANAYLIPNRVLLLGGVAAAILLACEVLLAPDQAIYALGRTLIATVALLIASLLCRVISPKAVGMGDIKLLAVMGLCLGMDSVWSALFLAFLVLFFYCIFLLITKRAKRTDSIPFAPFMLVGMIAAAFLTGI